MTGTEEQLNTRDRLLLVQLIEQHGGLSLEDEASEVKLQTIHEELTEHPVFKLSHNALNGTALEISPEQLKDAIASIYAAHPDRNIVQLCEFFYNERIEEIQNEIEEASNKFAETKSL